VERCPRNRVNSNDPKSSDYSRVFFQAEVFRTGRLAERRPRPSDTIIERARRVPVFRDCDVPVAGP
jgi:hypothetical protein